MELALYSECAGKYGKFWEYYNFVHHQSNISGANQIASAIGLTSADLEACLEDGTSALLQTQVEKAKSLAIVGTPTFYINGQKFIGSKSIPFLKGVVEALID
jgi:protein-disulfide isomerase